MLGKLSLVDVMGIIGFVWSFISFYIGYLWYKEGANKDAQIAKLTADNELLRREIEAISSHEGGRKQKELALQRSIDRRSLDKLNQFYQAAFSFSHSRINGDNIYFAVCLATAVTISIATAILTESSASSTSLYVVFALILVMLLRAVLFPIHIIIDDAVIGRRLDRLEALLDREGFSFQVMLLVKNWLDQQEWKDRELKDVLSRVINTRLSRLERLVPDGIRATASPAA